MHWVQVHLKSLLVIIIVISSQLLQEASKSLCRLGVFLLQPLKDILNALLVDALGDNFAKQHLAVALVCCLHVSSSLHDSSALVVNRGKVVPAAGSDGSQDGWVLLLGSPLASASPPASPSLPGQALTRNRLIETLLTSCVLGGISVAGMVTVSVNESLHHQLLHCLPLAP